MSSFIFESHQVPLENKCKCELIDLWEPVFPESIVEFMEVCDGQEAEFNDDYIFTARLDGKLVASLRLTVSKKTPLFSGVGEVVTIEQCRGKGIASTLIRMAVELFKNAGGEVLFLGTHNPAAASIYQKSGWKRWPHSNVYINVLSKMQPEEYLLNYFKQISGDFVMHEFSPAVRLGVIPLVIYPHDFRNMDANIKMSSIRYEHQKSCMGLYSKYLKVIEDGGNVISIYKSNILIGMFSIINEESVKCIDGFVFPAYSDKWAELLYRAAIKDGLGNNTKYIVRVDMNDIWKMKAVFESSHFVKIEAKEKNVSTFQIIIFN